MEKWNGRGVINRIFELIDLLCPGMCDKPVLSHEFQVAESLFRN
jgi:hypothetical protein